MRNLFKFALLVLMLFAPSGAFSDEEMNRKLRELNSFKNFCGYKTSAEKLSSFPKIKDHKHWTNYIQNKNEICKDVFANSSVGEKFTVDSFNSAFEYIGGLELLVKDGKWKYLKGYQNLEILPRSRAKNVFREFKQNIFGASKSKKFLGRFNETYFDPYQIPAFKELFAACQDENLVNSQIDFAFLNSALREIEAKSHFLERGVPVSRVLPPPKDYGELRQVLGEDGLAEACNKVGAIVEQNIPNYVNHLVDKIENKERLSLQCYSFTYSIYMAKENISSMRMRPNTKLSLQSLFKAPESQKTSQSSKTGGKELIYSRYSSKKAAVFGNISYGNSKPLVQNELDLECEKRFIRNLTKSFKIYENIKQKVSVDAKSQREKSEEQIKANQLISSKNKKK